MARPNFEPMRFGMPLVCGGLECEGWWDFEDMCVEAEHLTEEFNEGLTYHRVNVSGGYYSGFQFVVEEIHGRQFDLSKDSKYCIDNEDAWYHFGKCRSRVLREADAEKRKIRKWLEKVAVDYGYDILVCVGVFSNGEALYERRSA